MENDRIAKRVFVGECAGSCSVGRPRKRWIDNIKVCLKKRGLDVRQARRMVHDRSVWWGFVRGECMGHCLRDEPLTLMRCHSCEIPQPYEVLEGWKSICDQKAKISAFLFFAGNREIELKLTTFSSLLLFMFSCLSSSPDPPPPKRYSTFECCLLGLPLNNNHNIYIHGVGLGSIIGGHGARARVILVYVKCICNALVVHLVFPAFNVTDSLGFPPR